MRRAQGCTQWQWDGLSRGSARKDGGVCIPEGGEVVEAGIRSRGRRINLKMEAEERRKDTEQRQGEDNANLCCNHAAGVWNRKQCAWAVFCTATAVL